MRRYGEPAQIPLAPGDLSAVGGQEEMRVGTGRVQAHRALRRPGSQRVPAERVAGGPCAHRHGSLGQRDLNGCRGRLQTSGLFVERDGAAKVFLPDLQRLSKPIGLRDQIADAGRENRR